MCMRNSLFTIRGFDKDNIIPADPAWGCTGKYQSFFIKIGPRCSRALLLLLFNIHSYSLAMRCEFRCIHTLNTGDAIAVIAR